jgi:hypothetical protein
MFSNCKAARLFSHPESTATITESHPNVDRNSLQKLCKPSSSQLLRNLREGQEFPSNGQNRLEEQRERESACRRFILDLYHAKPMNGHAWIHGTKSGRMVHVGAVDAPETLADVNGHPRRNAAPHRVLGSRHVVQREEGRRTEQISQSITSRR